MAKIRKVDKDNTIATTNSPVIKADLASREFCVHLGPFMPFSSGGLGTPIDTSRHVIKTNSTIKIAAPAKQ